MSNPDYTYCPRCGAVLNHGNYGTVHCPCCGWPNKVKT